VGSALEQGRDAFDRAAWATAADELTKAGETSALAAPDLDLLAQACYLAGRDTESIVVLEQAHHAYLASGEVARAARCGYLLTMSLTFRGEGARSAGWLARSQRLVDEPPLDCAERGFLLVPLGYGALLGSDPAAAYDIFERALEIGTRFAEPDLVALARHGQGQVLIRTGQAAAGVALLDEVMTSLTAGEVSPITTGVIYCAVVETCFQICDVERAREWTSALTQWCAAQPELVPYRGQCLVHRSEVMQYAGEWGDALRQAELARDRLSVPVPHPALGVAMYQLAELHRLAGRFADAEACYRAANEHGYHPQPGLALLRLAQGRTEQAVAAIRGAEREVTERLARSKVLAAYVEIVLSADESDGDGSVRRAADELSELASSIGAPMLAATALHAKGAVLLVVEDRAQDALEPLREAAQIWRSQQAQYDGARTQVLLGIARRLLGDDDTASLELDGARRVFQELGARPDVERVELVISSSRPTGTVGGLSPRELEVLRLVATGRSNAAIADELVLSDRTVARHVSNIFAKLGLTSRSAATAYAYQHHLV
jgi:ATP/maltotriose-dependent transcriptional regulator MalT